MIVTILGGTGLLGQHVARILEERNVEVVIAGRSATGANGVVVDIETGEGLEPAIEPSDTIIHLASNSSHPKRVDVAGTRRLLPLLGDRHLIFMSIVGVDQHPFPYYRAKFEVEEMIRASTARFSIVRATQFHDLVAFMLSKLTKPPITVVPKGFVFQPVESTEVATFLADVALSEPGGDLPDFAGPEVIPVETLARAYMSELGRERPILRIPIPGKVARAFRDGVNTNPDRAVGRKTWSEFLLDHR